MGLASNTAASGGNGTSLSSVAQSLSDPVQQKIIGNMESEQKKQEEFTDKKLEHMEGLSAPTPPKMTEAPKSENYQTDPMQTFGSTAMFLSIFGSLLSRQPLTNALNSGAAVYKAINTKDSNNFNKAFEKWKVDSENAWKMVDWDLKVYEAAVKKDRTAIEMYTASHKNDTAKAALEARISDQNLKNQKKALADNRKAGERIQKFVDDSTAKENKERAEKGLPPLADVELDKFQNQKSGEAAVDISGFSVKEEYKEKEKGKASISDDTAKFAADQILAGDKSALSNYGRGEKATANLALIHEKVQQMAAARGISGADLAAINAQFAGFQAEQRAVGSRAGAVTYAASEVDTLMPIAKKAVAAVNLSGFPDLAHLENYAKEHKGDQRYQFAYDTVQELQNAYTSLLVRNGVRSDAAQNLSQGVINLNMGKRNIAGAFDAISQSKNAIMSAAPAARETIVKDMVFRNGGKKSDVGKAPSESDVNYLIAHPDSRDSFDKHFGDGASDSILSGVPE